MKSLKFKKFNNDLKTKYTTNRKMLKAYLLKAYLDGNAIILIILKIFIILIIVILNPAPGSRRQGD